MLKMLKRIGLIVGLVIGTYCLTGCGEKSVDLNTYIAVVYEGVDTKGTAEAVVLEETLTPVLAEALGVEVDVADEDLETMEDLGEALVAMDKVEQALNCFDIAVSPAEGLSNGDEVTITAEIDEEKAKELGVKFKFTEKKETVSGLIEAIEISNEELWGNIVVEFVGISPNAEVQVRNLSNHEVVSELEFAIDERFNIAKGDTVALTVSDTDRWEEQGYCFESMEKEYVVDTVDYYATSFEELPQEFLGKILDQAEDMVEAELLTGNLSSSFYNGDSFVSEINSSDSISDAVLKTSYFTTLKDGCDTIYGEGWNSLKIVYEFDAAGMGGGIFEAPSADYEDCYIAIVCENIIMTKDGNVEFDVSNMHFSSGYSTYETFYLKHATELKAQYEIQEVQLENQYAP